MPEFRVVILSRRPQNCVRCVQAIFREEPALPRERITVVDDGARAEAEAQLPGITWVAGATPFGFAVNANIGIRAAGDNNVILLNDDAFLRTPNGFTRLAQQAELHERIGILSAGIDGVVGNPGQEPQGTGFHRESAMVAFVCVYIKRRAVREIGLLDEQFNEGYGCDDSDYCRRALAAGFHIGVYDRCVVDHSDENASTYRTRPDHAAMYARNLELYRSKKAAIDALRIQPGLERPGAAGRPQFMAAALRVALQEVGVREDPVHSNSGPRVNQYLASVGLEPGQPWCAAFVYWCAQQAANSCGRNPVPLPRTGWTPSIWDDATQNGRAVPAADVIRGRVCLDPGSLFVLHGTVDGVDRVRHVGFVAGLRDGMIETVEGNTDLDGSGEGDGVYRRLRNPSSVHGFVLYG